MKKISTLKILSIIILISSMSSVLYAEKTAIECDNTWAQSSAKKSCGENICTYRNVNYFTNARVYYKQHPEEIFRSSYNPQTNECTFNTLCVADNSKGDKEVHMKTDASGKKIAGVYSDNKEVTCHASNITVPKDTYIKNEDGQLKLDHS